MRAKYVRVRRATGRGVAERWRAQYLRDGKWYDIEKASIHGSLCALGDNPDIEDVAKIIGNQSWSFLACSGCSDYVRTAIEIGEGYQDIILCPTCIAEAAEAISQKEQKQ